MASTFLLLSSLLSLRATGGTSPSSLRTYNYTINFSAAKYTPSSLNYTTLVDPATTWGIWEGWGVSLCWWAHVLGQSELLADAVFSTQKVEFRGKTLLGLGLNIVRVNLGASAWRVVDGQSMVASPHIPPFKQIPGFWLDWYNEDPSSSSWDWHVDRTRFSMVRMAKERGANIFELFSNSPMWWMLKNHNPSGSLDGVANNLQDWNFRNFTKYLAITVEHFRTQRGIDISYVEPFNEPVSDYWSADGSQEGCHFDRSLQAWILGLLADELQKRGLNATSIAASDEWKYDYALETWNAFDERTKALVGKVNTHGYQYTGGRRDKLRDAVRGKTLWNSEYGDGSASGMEMATNLNLDFRWLHPVAWCYWQAVDESDGWGLFQADLRSSTPHISKVNTKFFVLAHYSRHILPGMAIIDGGEDNTVAAYSSGECRLVLVTVNYGKAQWVTYDLSRFRLGRSSTATLWRTNMDGGDSYKEYHHVQAGPSLTVHFAANTIQTIQVEDVSDATQLAPEVILV